MNTDRLLRFIRFGLVGGVGFVVDLGVVFALVYVFELDPVVARIPAWITAVSTTYLFNLLFTFRSTRFKLVNRRQKLARYCLYILSQLGGGLLNILSFVLLVSLFGVPWSIAIVIGTLFGMILNYLGAATVISRRRDTRN